VFNCGGLQLTCDQRLAVLRVAAAAYEHEVDARQQQQPQHDAAGAQQPAFVQQAAAAQ